MRLHALNITNFRAFEQFSLVLAGESLMLVAPNAGGKTALLTAVSWALGGPRGVSRADFRDPGQPLEIRATLSELDPADQSTFVDAVDFGPGGANLVIGVRAIWDDFSEQLDTTWGYPERDWQRLGRDAREQLGLIWLPADRDPARILAFYGARSLLAELVDSLPLDQPLDTATAAIGSALDALVADQVMVQLLGSLDSDLGALIPDVAPGSFDVDASSTTPSELLALFELMLGHFGPHMPIRSQSSGLAQLAAFVVALQLARSTSNLVLIDEPEISLHPQAQRAVAASVQGSAHQSLIATHSSSVLSGADARNIVRLKRGTTDIEARRPTGLTDDDAAKIGRYSTPETAEAYFARTVLFVEGPSDYLALRVVANIVGVDLDARGAALISLQGAKLLATYLRLLGPQGLDLDLAGLCDVDAEQDWRDDLTAAGIGVADRAAFNAAGFYVCDVDLEDELVRALGDSTVEAVIATEGDTARFTAFANQPPNRGLGRTELLTAFARKNKVRWSPRLASELTPANVPSPLTDLLSRA